ncbi:MAG TPA: cytochrome c oxidase subunit II [Candidatus Limnocylindrales bacterium]
MSARWVPRGRAMARTVPVAVFVGLAGLAAGGCMPEAATEQGRRIGDLYRVFLGAGIVVALLVWGLATFAVLRYRRRGQDDELPRQVSGSLRLEAIWTGIPLVTVVALFGLTLLTLNAVNARSPDPGVDLRVTAFRWGWQAEYPGRAVTLTGLPDRPLEIVVPVGQAIHVTLASADVIHAFFVPRFLFKRDAIPGREASFDLRVEQPGSYPGTCAEFCGVYHDRMPFSVRAVGAAEFDAWLADRAAASARGPSGPATP